jgi:three-Cys-motif partner protein
LQAWGGIILSGISRSSVRDAHFAYVDANAYRGWYPGDQSDVIDHASGGVVYGSPIIGIEVLDELVAFAKEKYSIRLQVNVILVEKDGQIFGELVEALRQKGYSSRLLINPTNLATIAGKQIATINDDSTTIVDRLVDFTSSGKKFSFYFLDPFGASGIPLSYVDKVITRPRHDVMINFPYLDLHRKTGLTQKPDLSIGLEQRLRDCDRMFGHNRWRTVASQMDAVIDQYKSLDLEQHLVDSYRESLASIDPDLAVKSIRLRFPDRERTMYYLFLTTHDPTGALAMNELLWKAKLMENELRWQLREVRVAGQKQLLLFHTPAPPPRDQPEIRPSKEEIANHISQMLHGRLLLLRDVYRLLADELYFANEIKSALRFLRAQKRLEFTGDLRNRTELKFQ